LKDFFDCKQNHFKIIRKSSRTILSEKVSIDGKIDLKKNQLLRKMTKIIFFEIISFSGFSSQISASTPLSQKSSSGGKNCPPKQLSAKTSGNQNCCHPKLLPPKTAAT
jgi:hypothetical protein